MIKNQMLEWMWDHINDLTDQKPLSKQELREWHRLLNTPHLIKQAFMIEIDLQRDVPFQQRSEILNPNGEDR